MGAVDMVDTADTVDITVERDLLKPIPPLSQILKPKLMPGEAMVDMAVDTVDMVDTVVDTVDMVDTAVVDTVDLLNLTLSLMPLPTMVDTMVLDTVVDTVDTDMAVMVMVVVMDMDCGDVKGGPLNLIPLLMPGDHTMADTDTAVDTDTADTVVDMVMVVMATTDKCHLSSQI